jgi:hypothetical protein
MTTVASVVTETFNGLTAEGRKIYNINAVMTDSGAGTDDKTTITCTRLRKIKGTPGLTTVGNDSGGIIYVVLTAVSGNVITLTLNAAPGAGKIMNFVGTVIGD